MKSILVVLVAGALATAGCQCCPERYGESSGRHSSDHRTGMDADPDDQRSRYAQGESSDSARIDRSDWTSSPTSLDANRDRARNTYDATRPTYDDSRNNDGYVQGGRQPTNSGVNSRDRDGVTPTPFNQTSNESDVNRIATIRKRIMSSDLSLNAQNVKVMSQNGRVTLRGPVDSQFERDEVARIARDVAGAGNVDDLIEVVMAR